MNFFKGFAGESDRIEKIGRIMVGDVSVEVDCIPNTGIIYINGAHMPYNMTIEQSLAWVTHENISQLKLEQLFFQTGNKVPRLAHLWETRTFLMSHWKYYAMNAIKVTAILYYPDDDTNTFFL